MSHTKSSRYWLRNWGDQSKFGWINAWSPHVCQMLKPKEKYKFTNAKYSIDMNKENKIFDILLKD